MSLVLTDSVLVELDRRLAEPEPEQGGALLRPVNGRAVTHFEWDEFAATTSVSYVPSRELVERVSELESTRDLTLAGVVHSHPNGLNRLSGPDLQVTRHLLQRNRHLGWVCMPIVTQLLGDVPIGTHELQLPHGRLSSFLGRLDDTDRLHLARPSSIRVVPVEQLSLTVAAALGWRRCGWELMCVDGVALLGCRFEPGPGLPAVWVLLSHDFPYASPLVALDPGDGLSPHPLPIAASTSVDAALDRLVDSLGLLGLRSAEPVQPDQSGAPDHDLES
jgi:proteasome lid subunit RPN8/RPN11